MRNGGDLYNFRRVRGGNLRQHQSAEAHALALSLLPGGPWQIKAGTNGRPQALGEDGRPGPDISLSHSGTWVAAAAAEHGRVGIDIEVPRPGRNARAVADAYFSPCERRLVETGGQSALLALWCMREAVAKLTGGGVADALALDGAGLVAGVDGTATGMLGDTAWVLAHRRHAQFQLALAWAPPSTDPTAPAALAWAIDGMLAAL